MKKRIIKKINLGRSFYFPQFRFLWRWWHYEGEYGYACFQDLKDAVEFINRGADTRSNGRDFDVVWEVEG